nr:hypothetical protein [Tanacetum cinerariifolium]
MLRRKLYDAVDDDSSSDEKKKKKKEKKQEQEWTLEEMKHYYYAGIHDHIKCVEAEEQHELQSGFYYKLEAKCGDNLIERLAS